MTPHAPAKLNTQTYQAACEWFVEFRAGEPDENSRRAFHAWLSESPTHMGAYLDVAANWNLGGSIDLTRRWSADELIAEAVKDTAVVVAHPSASAALSVHQPPRAPSALTKPSSTRKQARQTLAACLTAGLAITGLVLWQNHVPSYSTGIGEQRSIALRDGSTVSLNSRSSIRIRYSAHVRGIELLEGQALFAVAKDASRPFIVTSGATQVRAVGTQFDVYRKKAVTVVTVVEGRIAVDEADASVTRAGEVSFVSAGEQVTIGTHAVAHPMRANVAAATAWTQRQLVFDSTPLRDVADEFNRYNERQFVIRDASLDTFQIDGVFSSTDPSSLIRFLRARPEMQVAETDSQVVISRR